jgi:hypothetical protein
VVYGPKMHRWVEPMPSLICVNPIIFAGHTPLVFHQVVLHVHIIFNKAVNERLCIREVGVDLELCVHAHRHTVDLIMEASLKINCSLGISLSCTCELILCNHGSDHIYIL